MRLDDYIKIYPGGQVTLAEVLGVSYTTIWRWANGKVLPSRKYVKEIERISRGAVKPADWY